MAYQAAERYRREHAASIAAELKVESKALGDQEVDAIRREVASLREDEPAEPAGCPACGGYRLVPCAHPYRRELPVPSGEVEDRATVLDDGCRQIRARTSPVPRSIQTVVHETRVSVGVDLGEQEIERLGRVGGRLARIGERPDGLLLVAALRAMHTPGAAAGPASVLALTPAGRKLVADHARGWSDDPTPDQVLDRVRARQREAPDVRTGSLLADARAQAEELVERAVAAWVASARPKRPDEPAQPPTRKRIKAPKRQDVARIAELVREALKGAGGGEAA
jgi:hypothetical protein